MLNELYEYLVQAYLPQRYPTMFRINSSTNFVKNVITNDTLPLRAPSDRSLTLQLINRNVD